VPPGAHGSLRPVPPSPGAPATAVPVTSVTAWTVHQVLPQRAPRSHAVIMGTP